MSKPKPKIETVEDPAFVGWIQETITIGGVKELARALQTTPAVIRGIVKTGRTPKSIYEYASDPKLGFLHEAHEPTDLPSWVFGD